MSDDIKTRERIEQLERQVNALTTALSSAGDLYVLLATELSANGWNSEAGDILVRIAETLGAQLATSKPFASASFSVEDVMANFAEESQLLHALELADENEPNLPNIDLAFRVLREIPHDINDGAAAMLRGTAAQHITTALQIVVTAEGWSIGPIPQ